MLCIRYGTGSLLGRFDSCAFESKNRTIPAMPRYAPCPMHGQRAFDDLLTAHGSRYFCLPCGRSFGVTLWQGSGRNLPPHEWRGCAAGNLYSITQPVSTCCRNAYACMICRDDAADGSVKRMEAFAAPRGCNARLAYLVWERRYQRRPHFPDVILGIVQYLGRQKLPRPARTAQQRWVRKETAASPASAAFAGYSARTRPPVSRPPCPFQGG